ncbi:MAG: helix-turn-helix transcriptional regulator [Pseudobutyrivibrio sp.]|uniref:helix-turn-helix domain-containing protein n=1 Tax=Pseudobutyrivibrio sp. TaxID=2014367 RepID=UPI0025D09C20|nr:helix-turn-helix transcriptional regulator [Pseudobutyrivibrio sp.]MBQ8488727.1 helix-turn-helix transcriptional regulator [Pseudobutyrivibrio sp.]
MYEKDLIHFHTLMESVREYRNVNIEVLAKGLYSLGNMHYIQTGDRLPDYLMRNRIMGRLGVSSEGYEDYVQFDEYERWENREKLLLLIEDSKWEEARDLYNSISKSWKRVNKVEKQFLLDVEARILAYEGASDETVYRLYEKTVYQTMSKNVSFTIDDRIVLSPVEIYYVINWLLYMPANEKTPDKIAELFENLIKYIENSFLEDIAKAKILPFAVWAYFNTLKKYGLEADYHKAWRHSNKAIELLKKTERFYYLKEIVKARSELASHLEFHIDELLLEKDVVDILDNLASRYDITIPMAQSGYIYRDSIVNCIATVIHDRRRMLGITREKLAEGICSKRTIERIEAKKSKPQQFVMKSLFEKMGLLAEYRRAQIVTDDINVINIFNDYRVAINQRDFATAYAKMDCLLEWLDRRYIPNKQAIIRMLNIRQKMEIGLDKESYIKNLQTALSFSIKSNIINRDYYYLTAGEIVLLYNIATQLDGDNWQKKVLDFCSEFTGPMRISHFPSYELIKDWEASMLGNSGKYIESNKISEVIIKTTFRLNRFHGLYMASYNVCWNNYEAEKTEATKIEFNKDVLGCAKICDFCNNKKLSFYMSELK